eukprot:1159965-Pelagomonas_calceolata.AAC.15
MVQEHARYAVAKLLTLICLGTGGRSSRGDDQQVSKQITCFPVQGVGKDLRAHLEWSLLFLGPGVG